jgi:[acyl-carrier-protein] S-malonyltransferase
MTAGQPALLCPGAGTHFPAMGRRLHDRYPSARQTLSALAQVVGPDLVDGCLSDSPAHTRTIEQSYPATVATGLLAEAALVEEVGRRPGYAVAGGYSLGLFTALAVAGALAVADTIALVAARARLMQRAADQRAGAMVLVTGPAIGAVREEVDACPAALGRVVIACVNSPSAVMLSGDQAAVARVAGRLAGDGTEVKAARTGVASHSPLMRGAQDELNACLALVSIVEPERPVLLNSDGGTTTDPGRIRDELRIHLVTPVRWDLCARTLAEIRPDVIVDTGPGSMMARLTEGIAPAIILNAAAPLADVVASLRSSEVPNMPSGRSLA